MTLRLYPTLIALAALANPAAAATVGSLQGDTSAQAPMGAEASSRYATDSVDDNLLAALSSGTFGPLFAAGPSVTLQYLGTGAARSATLSFGASELFQTRSGCSYAVALVDDFCIIDSVGKQRTISGLNTGEALSFSLVAQAQLLGDAAHQRSTAATFDSVLAARRLDLGAGSYLLGFEEDSDASYNDMVFLVTGVTTVAPAVPEPSSPALLTLGALLLALERKRAA